jgi:hypothetical protein
MAQSTDSTVNTTTTYSQTGTSTQPGMAPSQPGTYKGPETVPPLPQHPGAAGGGAEGGGGGGGK